MTVINTNVSSLLAQNALQQSNSKLQTALTRLSTGLQINSGADNPAGLIDANTLGAQITAENQSIANAQQGNDIISTASGALAQVSNQLNSIRGLVQAAASKGGVSSSEISADQQQVDAALQSIERIGQTTVFGGQNLLNGSLSFQAAFTSGAGPLTGASGINVSSFNPALHQGGGTPDVSVDVTHAATQKTVSLSGSALSGLTAGGATQSKSTLLINGAGGLGAAGNTVTGAAFSLTVTGNKGTSAAITVSAADAAAFAAADNSGGAVDAAANDLVNSINAQANATGVIASYTNGGDITLKAAQFGAAGTISYANAGGNAAADNTALTAAEGATVAGTAATTTNTTTLNISGDLGNAVVLVNNDALLSGSNALVSAINSVTSQTGVTAALAATSTYSATSVQHTGSDYGANVVLTSQNYGGSAVASVNAIAATGGSADTNLFNAGSTQTVTAGTDAGGTVTTKDGVSNFTAAGNTISLNSSDLAFTASLTAGQTGTAGFSVSGGALFQIGTNVDYQDQVTVNIPQIDTNTLGLGTTSDPNNGLASLSTGGSNQLSSSDLTNAANIVNEAINQVSTLQGNLGALQTYVFQSNINSLQTGVEQVTQAQSDIQDTNFAAETASLTQAQILVQAGTSVLSIANSRPQSVLSLLPH
jgi:flagellin